MSHRYPHYGSTIGVSSAHTKDFTPMSLDASNKLSDLIKRIAEGVTIDIHQMRGTAYAISISYKGQEMRFHFDQGGRHPDAADCISALWARASVISQGEEHFYQTFHKKAYEDMTEHAEPLKQEYVDHFEEWEHNAAGAWRVFGDWFGKRWE